MVNEQQWICMHCGRMVYYPSVDEERRVVCTHCKEPELVEIPAEQMMGVA